MLVWQLVLFRKMFRLISDAWSLLRKLYNLSVDISLGGYFCVLFVDIVKLEGDTRTFCTKF